MAAINLDKQKIALNNVSFNRFEKNSAPSKLLIEDSINQINIEGRNVSFIFKREAKFEPKSLFDISVEFLYSAEISEGSLKTLLDEGKSFDYDFIKEIAPQIIKNTAIISNASFIIAANTSLNGANPLITPPSFIVMKK